MHRVSILRGHFIPSYCTECYEFNPYMGQYFCDPKIAVLSLGVYLWWLFVKLFATKYILYVYNSATSRLKQ